MFKSGKKINKITCSGKEGVSRSSKNKAEDNDYTIDQDFMFRITESTIMT